MTIVASMTNKNYFQYKPICLKERNANRCFEKVCDVVELPFRITVSLSQK